MTARILVVDDLPVNARLLEAKLTAEYYQVTVVDNGHAAIEVCKAGGCDLVLLDVMMPNLSGFEVCRILKSDADTLHIPVVLVTALDAARDRVEGLEAGADDFLTKPVSDVALLARVKSLLRLKLLVDELRMRAATAQDVQLEILYKRVFASPSASDLVLIADDRESSAKRMRDILMRAGYRVVIEQGARRVVDLAIEKNPTLAIVNLDIADYDGLRLCSELRAHQLTRNLPLLAVSDETNEARLSKALDLGVNDYVTRPIEPNELLARAMTQLRRERYTDYLRESVQTTMELAIKDPLTGLYNRRYLQTYLANHVKIAGEKNTPLSLLVL
ncbi:MAG: response regulator, partial [Pseudomonadota bacterium]